MLLPSVNYTKMLSVEDFNSSARSLLLALQQRQQLQAAVASTGCKDKLLCVPLSRVFESEHCLSHTQQLARLRGLIYVSVRKLTSFVCKEPPTIADIPRRTPLHAENHSSPILLRGVSGL